MKTHRLVVSAGTGPEEVRRFVVLLAARLKERALALGLLGREEPRTAETRVPRSLTLIVSGNVERLHDEIGTHVLLAHSPKRGRAARKRWFAGVSLHEPAAALPEVRSSEVLVRASRANGPGGQNVNKRSTAVRLSHAATGANIRVSAERSQHANRRLAQERFVQTLADRAAAESARAAARERLSHYQVERGRAVRSYALGPHGELVEHDKR